MFGVITHRSIFCRPKRSDKDVVRHHLYNKINFICFFFRSPFYLRIKIIYRKTILIPLKVTMLWFWVVHKHDTRKGRRPLRVPKGNQRERRSRRGSAHTPSHGHTGVDLHWVQSCVTRGFPANPRALSTRRGLHLGELK